MGEPPRSLLSEFLYTGRSHDLARFVAVDVGEHLLVRKAYDVDANAVEISGALCVPLPLIGFTVVGTVDLDSQSTGCRVEVEDVAVDAVLTEELDAVESPIAELSPEGLLCRRLATPQLPSGNS